MTNLREFPQTSAVIAGSLILPNAVFATAIVQLPFPSCRFPHGLARR
jgi:hypothetical protein